MIPTDLAARLRLLNESSVQPLPQVRPLPSDLPEFQRGQRFTAQIQNALPDGSFRALVAGKNVTLSLEHAAKAGDTLELVVIDRSAKAISAALASQTSPTAPTATLSRAAQLIGALLADPRQGAAGPAVLARGQPLLANAPASAAPLVPLLKQAAIQSGLFYESHQAQWVSGRMPLAALLQEPQGRLSPLLQPTPAQGSALATPARAPAPGPEVRAGLRSERPIAAAAGVDDQSAPESADDLLARTQSTAERPPAAAAISRELAPIVQQQLEALASHHLAWQGQVWPGQSLRWEIEDPLRDHGDAEAEGAQLWRTTMQLEMPRLGALRATLTLTPDGLSVAVSADSTQSAARLNASRTQLETALAAAGLPLLGFSAEHDGAA